MQPSQLSVYVNPQVSLNLMGEREAYTGTSGGWTFSHEDSDTKIEHLSLKLTQHRLILFHPSNKTNFNFEFFFDQVSKYEIQVSNLSNLQTKCCRLEVCSLKLPTN